MLPEDDREIFDSDAHPGPDANNGRGSPWRLFQNGAAAIESFPDAAEKCPNDPTGRPATGRANCIVIWSGESGSRGDVVMSTGEQGQLQSSHREEAIQQQIVERTGGRIRMPEVRLIDDRIVIRGSVPRYYHKQLVLQAVLDLIGPASATRIELNVQVLQSPTNRTGRMSRE
jgi:hypothetical protein